jgi:hypothetical protein
VGLGVRRAMAHALTVADLHSCLAPPPNSTPHFILQQYSDENTESDECAGRILQTWSKCPFPGNMLFPKSSRQEVRHREGLQLCSSSRFIAQS